MSYKRTCDCVIIKFHVDELQYLSHLYTHLLSGALIESQKFKCIGFLKEDDVQKWECLEFMISFCVGVQVRRFSASWHVMLFMYDGCGSCAVVTCKEYWMHGVSSFIKRLMKSLLLIKLGNITSFAFWTQNMEVETYKNLNLMN